MDSKVYKKKKIKIAYVDFWEGFDSEGFVFTSILRGRYEVEINEDNPDYIFYSTFGYKHLNYECPRIFFTGEACCPDFNICDYAIGFERMVYEDRYLRYPLYLMNNELLEAAKTKHLREDDYFKGRKEFCSFVVSASGGLNDLRNWYFDKISDYKKVNSGGRFRNNLADGKPVPDKKAFQEQHRFSLCFENASISGYATEKLVDAFAAGCIPIYYGDENIEKDFNEKAFIHVRSKDDLQLVLERIKELEESVTKYMAMTREPALKDDSPIHAMQEEGYLSDFLYNIFDQDLEKALRRQSKLTMWGHFYEYRIKKWIKKDNTFLVRTARKLKRRIFGLKKIV